MYQQIIEFLKSERQTVSEAILALERLLTIRDPKPTQKLLPPVKRKMISAPKSKQNSESKQPND